MSHIATQVSRYPLRQERLAPAIDSALRIFREFGLDVVPGPMSTIVTGNDEALFAALESAFRQASEQGHVVMNVTFSNACPAPDTTAAGINYEPIGQVDNAFDEPGAPAAMAEAESKIILKPALVEGLSGLKSGRQLMVIFHFHRTQGYELQQHPQGEVSRPTRGVFALRSPRRPIPIGVTVVELLAIEGNVLRVRGLDALNGSPVLDLKPV